MYQDSFAGAAKRGFMSLPVAIRTLIAINVVVFILQAFLGQNINRTIIESLAFNPDWTVAFTQPWRFVTYMFLHGSGFHLLFNMLWLWWMGRSVETTLGPRTFLVLYFGSGIGGAALNVIFSFLLGSSLVIGASGAVFGIMVSFAYLFPRTPIMLIFFPPIEARFVVAGLIALDLLFIGSGDNIARAVHLGGAGVGYLLIDYHYKGFDLSLLVRKIENLWQKPAPKRKRNKNMYSVSDVKIVDETEESELDKILEKISEKGYDGLTDEEKKKLFDLSKRN
ncbi:MAG: rhomboid family intramembrane serine protease [Balneolaceae bacterium]